MRRRKLNSASIRARAASASRLPQFGVFGQPAQAPRQGVGRAGRHRQHVGAVARESLDPAAARRKDRHLHRHRLQHDVRQAFAQAGQAEQVEVLEQRYRIGLEAEQADAVPVAGRDGLTLQLVPGFAIARDPKLQVAALRRSASPRPGSAGRSPSPPTAARRRRSAGGPAASRSAQPPAPPVRRGGSLPCRSRSRSGEAGPPARRWRGSARTGRRRRRSTCSWRGSVQRSMA